MNTPTISSGRARWSLRRRITLWIAAGVFTLLTLGLGGIAWFMNDALRRELDALATEELAEATLGCQRGLLTAERFAQLGKVLERDHPGFRLGLCLTRPNEKEPWIMTGSKGSRTRRVHRGGPSTEVNSPSRLQRRISNTIKVNTPDPDGLVTEEMFNIELYIDGTPRAEEILRVGSVFFVLALLGGATAIAGGALFSKRLASLLGEVATSAEAARLDESETVTSSEKAPAEIYAVAQAFQTSVEKMRAEHARNVLLTAGLAHELRSPLQNMVSEAEVALMKERDLDEYRRVIQEQLNEARSLALVVDNLVTLTALRDTQRLPRKERFDLGEETRMRLHRETIEAARKSVEIVIKDSGDLSIDGDREALILMIRNLVGNAIRWTPEETEITVTLQGETNEVLIAVQDEGSGVLDEEREIIFEAFRQGQSPQGSRTGYGLGLALARAAARSHEGEIHVANSARGGARFEVRIPRVRPHG